LGLYSVVHPAYAFVVPEIMMLTPNNSEGRWMFKLFGVDRIVTRTKLSLGKISCNTVKLPRVPAGKSTLVNRLGNKLAAPDAME
jgi:hypothetical protein